MQADDKEQQFRKNEKILDELLRYAESHLRFSGVSIENHSSPNYHYKNAYLCWSYSFLKEWLVELENARVTVYLSYSEPIKPNDTPEIRLQCKAEIFSQGQESKIDKRGERIYSLKQLETEGISNVVLSVINEASSSLASPNGSINSDWLTAR